jgi:hypothetical protein
MIQNNRERICSCITILYSIAINTCSFAFVLITSVLKKPEVVNELRGLSKNFVLIPAKKARNNIFFVWKGYYYRRLLNELGFTCTSISGNPTYTRSSLTKNEIPQNPLSLLNNFNIPKNQGRYILDSKIT